MKQQVATCTNMAVSTTKLKDYNIGVTWLIISGGGLVLGNQMPMFCAGKMLNFHFFLPLHHPNKCFNNVSVFYLPLLNSIAKKLFLGTKHIGWTFVPVASPKLCPCITKTYFVNRSEHSRAEWKIPLQNRMEWNATGTEQHNFDSLIESNTGT
jgi:hypothetical protein